MLNILSVPREKNTNQLKNTRQVLKSSLFQNKTGSKAEKTFSIDCFEFQDQYHAVAIVATTGGFELSATSAGKSLTGNLTAVSCRQGTQFEILGFRKDIEMKTLYYLISVGWI